MTSPSTATDDLAEEFEAATSRMQGSLDDGVPALEALTHGEEAYAEWFGEVTSDVLRQARRRVRGGRMEPTSFRTRRLLTGGYSVRAFDARRHALVSVQDGSPARPSLAVDALRHALRSATAGAPTVVHWDAEHAPEASHVNTGAWLPFVVDSVTDAAFAADERVVEVRVSRAERRVLRMIAPRSEPPLVVSRNEATLRVDVLVQAPLPHQAYVVADARTAEPFALGIAAVESALRRACAVDVSHGHHPLVTGFGWGGIWLHEAIGHALEADISPTFAARSFNRNPVLQAADDPTLPGGRGSYSFDDEGVPGTATALLGDGLPTGSLTDRVFALRDGLPLTGNGRRASYRVPPLPRMSNLVVSGGSSPIDELFREAEGGVYAVSFREGVLHGGDGRVRLVADEAYRIKDGAPAEALCDFTIELTPVELLQRVRAVGDDAQHESAKGVCVKAGQALPVGISAPSILLEAVPIRPA